MMRTKFLTLKAKHANICSGLVQVLRREHSMALNSQKMGLQFLSFRNRVRCAPLQKVLYFQSSDNNSNTSFSNVIRIAVDTQLSLQSHSGSCFRKNSTCAPCMSAVIQGPINGRNAISVDSAAAPCINASTKFLSTGTHALFVLNLSSSSAAGYVRMLELRQCTLQRQKQQNSSI